LNTVIHY